MKWYVDVAVRVPANDIGRWSDVNEILENAAGRRSDSAGTMLGPVWFRDMQWNDLTQEEAEGIEKRILATGLELEYHGCGEQDWDEEE